MQSSVPQEVGLRKPYTRTRSAYVPFSSLRLGARFQLDERIHGGQHKIWVKIGRNQIVEWEDKPFVGREQWPQPFNKDSSKTDELVFVE
jgi:hypothetical protein